MIGAASTDTRVVYDASLGTDSNILPVGLTSRLRVAAQLSHWECARILITEENTLPNMLALAGPTSRFAASGAPAGFWAGYWHGLVAPIACLLGIFHPGIRIYEVRNTGRPYDIGFVLGSLTVLGTTTYYPDGSVERTYWWPPRAH